MKSKKIKTPPTVQTSKSRKFGPIVITKTSETWMLKTTKSNKK